MATDGAARMVELSAADRLSYAAARLGATTGLFSWRRYVLVAVPVSSMPAMPPRGWEARVLKDAAPAGLVDPAVAAWRLRQGMDCVVAAPLDGEAAGVSWVGTGGFDEDEAHVRFEPPPGAAWDTGLYVRPEARGGRAFAALWAGTRAWAEARGVKWSMSRISDYNLGSRRSHVRLKAREVGRVTLLTRGETVRAWGAEPGHARVDGARPVARPPLP